MQKTIFVYLVFENYENERKKYSKKLLIFLSEKVVER